MYKKIQTALRLLIVGLLIYPMPIGMAQEVTVNEGFEDSNYEAGLTITTANNWSISDYSPNYGTTGNSFYMSVGTYTFEFSSDINVYELGFNVGGVDNSYSVKYYYSDGTDETLSMSAQNPSNAGTMYDNFYKSFTDYNNNEANTDKYITKFDVVVSDASLFDTLYWQYDDADATGSFGTTTTTTTTIPRTIGTPTNVSVKFDTVNGNDGFLVSWSAPTDGGYSPERYAVFFGEGECCQYAVATGNVGDANALNTYYFFSMDYLTNVFGSQYGDFYWKVRSDNDTEALYSGWSTTVHMNSTAPTTTTTSTTTTTTLPPPPPTTTTTTLPPKVEIIMDDGSTAEYTQKEVEDGTVERDNERKSNEEKWGCYVTNAALERGDCEAYNIALYESTTTTTTIPEIKEDEIIKEDDIIIEDTEVKDEDIFVEEVVEEQVLEPIEEDTTDGKVFEDGVKVEIKDETEEVLPEDDEPIVEEEVLVEEKDVDVPIESPIVEDKTEIIVAIEEDIKKIVVIEDEVITEDMTQEEVAQADKEFEEKVEAAVKELPKEKKVEIVKEVAKVKVQNLQGADNTTKAVVKAVVKEVTKTETVAQLSEEEKKDVGKVLGFQDETAADDVEIIAVQAEKEENIAKAVDEYVERAIANAEVENYTLADVITEVQIEAFIANPVAAIIDVDFKNIDFSTLGNDMTSDQKEKAQEVVVPVIIASQIIAQAGAFIRRPF